MIADMQIRHMAFAEAVGASCQTGRSTRRPHDDEYL
jgi:hypothetical protein